MDARREKIQKRNGVVWCGVVWCHVVTLSPSLRIVALSMKRWTSERWSGSGSVASVPRLPPGSQLRSRFAATPALSPP
jgi:hypothetical protein